MKKSLILLSLFGTLTVFAQEKMVVMRQSEVRNSKNSRSEKNEIRIVDHDHVLKFDPLRMIVGELNFSIEEKLGNRLTAEISAGPTISNLTGFGNGNNYYYYDYANDENVSKFGGFLNVGVRFYPLDNFTAFNRLYVSPSIRYKRLNEDIIPYDKNLEKQAGFTNSTSFLFNVGLQQWISKSLSFDYYVGFGMGSTSSQYYRTVTGYDPVTQLNVYTFQKFSESRAQFVFNAGVKVGIGWKSKK